MNIEARNQSISFHNKAIEVVKSDTQLAYRLLCSATVADPTMAVGWYAMGNALADLHQLPASISAFRRCLECPTGDEKGDLTPELQAKAMVNLGHRLVNNGQIDEAETVARDAIKLLEADPTLDQEGRAFAWTNLSLALSIQGKIGESLEYAKMAFEMSKEPIIETGLAFAHLFAGDYAEGLRHFHSRFAYRIPQFLSMPYIKWDGETGVELLVEADQGAGDTLSFARFISAASKRVKKLIFRVQPEILRMMTSAFSGLKNVEVIPQSPTFPIAAYWCPVVSLPDALGLTTEQIRDQRQVWEMPPCRSGVPQGWKIPGRFNIAIAYAGSPMNDIDKYRSIPVTEFLALYQVPGIQIYSVQVGERVKDLHDAGCASLIRDLSNWIKDSTDTVAILREVDLVISCESFVAHLAAATGIECWVPLSRLGGDYRMGRVGHQALWYPKTKIMRQGLDCSWGPVFDRMVIALTEKTTKRDGPITILGQVAKVMTYDMAASLWNYDPESGLFTWRVKPNKYGKGRIGGVVGHKTTGGYIDLRVSRVRYAAHRVAWLLMTGEWPSHEIDHVNRDGMDNRWVNLRKASREQNCANKSFVIGRSGFRGVTEERSGNWTAKLSVSQKDVHLGTFPSATDAAIAYDAGATKHFGKFAVLNFPDGPPDRPEDEPEEDAAG